MSGRVERYIQPETELRCEVSHLEVLSVKISEGSAEILGAELTVEKEYCFTGRNFAIFSWYGCKIVTDITCITPQQSGSSYTVKSHLYVSQDTPMTAYVNTHIQLEARRDVALANNEKGPRIMIVGPPDCGKTSMSQLLCNYALRLDRKPMLVDLDVDQGVSSMPGSVCDIPLVKACLSVDVSTPLNINN